MKCLSVFCSLAATIVVIESKSRVLVEDADLRLTVNLLKATTQDHENKVVSGVGIARAMGVCLLGARGETYLEMTEVMGLSGLERDEIVIGYEHSRHKLAKAQYDAGTNFTIKVASRLYVNQQYSVNRTYQWEAFRTFNAEVLKADFRSRGPAIQQNANAYIKDRTNGLISQLLPEPFPNTTRLAAVNALYFKGTWSQPFSNVDVDQFFNKEITSAKWMNFNGSLSYRKSASQSASIVEVPYIQNINTTARASMIFVLPDESFTANSWLHKKMDWTIFNTEVNNLRFTNVDLTVPKFDVAQTIDLAPTLKCLGMVSAFSDQADFSGVPKVKSNGLQIDTVVHFARIVVDENGTLAAAATDIGTSNNSVPAVDGTFVKVNLNRPFIAFVVLRRQDQPGVIPLLGAVVNKV